MATTGAIVNNPVLGFRPDPLEPAIRQKSTAKESALLVSAQEGRNKTRLTRVALQEGRVIISANRSYTPAVRGSYPAVVAGQTEVISQKRPENPLPSDNFSKYGGPGGFIPSEDTTEDPSSEAPPTTTGQAPSPVTAKSPAEASLPPDLANASKAELVQKEQTLRTEIQALETRKKSIEVNPDSPQTTREIKQVEFQVRNTEAELQKVQRARLLKTQSELLENLNQGMLNNGSSAAGLIQAAFGANENSIGAKFDQLA